MEFTRINDGVEVNPALDVRLLNASNDVIFKDRTWREGRDGFAEVFLVGVVSKLEAFLGPVGPEVSVHAGVNGLVMLIETSAPVVVPLATKLALLLEADDFGNIGSLILSGFESSEDGGSGRTSTDDTDSLLFSRFGLGFDHNWSVCFKFN
jgi:hypothetical protein